ncbi:MAG: hypothetical protein ACKV19_12600 [Verrucomicrobiales bacterium]
MSPRLLLVSATVGSSLIAFAAGVWCGPWLARRSSDLPTAEIGAVPRPPVLDARLSTGPLVLDPGQSKADARLALESPQAFLDSLRGESGLKAQARVAAAMSELPLAAVKELAVQLEARPFGGTPEHWLFNWAVFERWSELDPNDLLNASRVNSNRFIGYTGSQAAFRQLARRDPTSAWKQAQDVGTLTAIAKQAVLQTLGESNPAEALKLAQSDAVTRRDAWSVASFMQSWLMRDRDAALDSLGSIPAGEFRSNLVGQLGSAFAATDPEAALEWGRGLKNPVERQAALRQVVEVMAGRDPIATLALLDDPSMAQQRRDGLGTALGAWARRDFNAALDYALATKSPADQQQMLSALSGGATAAERTRLLEAAKNMSPALSKAIYQAAMNGGYFGGTGQNTVELVDQIKSVSVREELIINQLSNMWGSSTEDTQVLFAKLQPTSKTTEQASQIARRLAWGDPSEAVKWAEKLDSADLRQAALKSALQTWSHSDPQAAAQKALGVTDPIQRAEILRGVAQNWAGNDDKAALAWAQSLGGADQSAALGALVENSLLANPQQAQELYSKFTASLDAESAAKADNKRVARSVAATLTENDPQQAIAWAGSLPPGGAQNEAFAGIAEKWAGYDPVTTSEWIGTLPAGEGRDLAADKLVTTIARDDPDSAWVWATSIGDAAKRREAASRVLQAWKGYGRIDQARAALAAAGFTPDDTRELAKKLD